MRHSSKPKLPSTVNAPVISCQSHRTELYRLALHKERGIVTLPTSKKDPFLDAIQHARACPGCQEFWHEARARLVLIDAAQKQGNACAKQEHSQRLGDHLCADLSQELPHDLQTVRAVLNRLARPPQNI